MDNKSDTPPSKPSAASTDDESISTSTTESETFGTWTLVTDKHKKTNPATTNTSVDNTKNRVEVLKPDKDTEEKDKVVGDEKIDPKVEEDSTVDDLSDGISIISESESAGRGSPHLYLHDPLSDLNLKFDIFEQNLPPSHRTPPNSPIILSTASFPGSSGDNNTCELRQRRTSLSNSEANALERCTATANSDNTVRKMPPAIRRGLTGIFYLAVALAVLAFIGKLRYPEWEAFTHHKSIDELEQKLSDMELQNNLMRAEIDLLSKQVNHLQLLAEREERNGKGHQGKRRRDADVRPGQKVDTFKAWSGIGSSLDPVEITKNDLKRPYKCPDGKFVEIAGMCVENASEKSDAFVDEIGNVVDDVLQQSNFFEDVVAKVDAFTTDSGDNVGEQKSAPRQFETKIKGAADGAGATPGQQIRVEQKQHKRESGKFKKMKNSDGSSKERHYHDDHVEKQNKFWKTPHHNHERHSNEYDDDDDDGHVSAESMENDNDDDDVDDSIEKNFNAPKYNSKERVGKYEFTSKMPKHYKIYKFGDKLDKDGHWHEKHMQNREYARRQNERQRNNKNWFIERGDGREQMRHS